MTILKPSSSTAGRLSRRAFVAALPVGLAACSGSYSRLAGFDGGYGAPRARISNSGRIDPYYLSMYGPKLDEPFPLPAIDIRRIDPVYWRQQVSYTSAYAPGTIVVDPYNRFLYLTETGGSALRYGVGVGRDGFGWSGRAVIKRKQEWPTWYPPKEMIARDPRAAPFANGQPPGLDNALGARALYLYQGDVDTLYRLHGTTEPWSIGQAMSSGCVRMLNQDVVDLYSRVPIGTEVVVLGSDGVA
ncbi:L,D-transpeptidase [Methylobrevis albus]|uniref:L,D-transpeptidase n=1 Tax=Methylobrevis albus TaxID=2793297 RepID=A0A931N096_9HYPH|nr:L,D-transpeptidase [Methylobrevis albus]MBH0239830.1 L,D-transpeptidase [Methylobrevis albus]